MWDSSHLAASSLLPGHGSCVAVPSPPRQTAGWRMGTRRLLPNSAAGTQGSCAVLSSRATCLGTRNPLQWNGGGVGVIWGLEEPSAWSRCGLTCPPFSPSHTPAPKPLLLALFQLSRGSIWAASQSPGAALESFRGEGGCPNCVLPGSKQETESLQND